AIYEDGRILPGTLYDFT
nr:hypothetical protein [Tanacetum cinerariifolium]